MIRPLRAAILIIVLLSLQVFALQQADNAKKRFSTEEIDRFVLSSSVLKLASLEFDDLAADFLFIKAMVFVGRSPEEQGPKGIKAADWRWIYKVLEVATDLDPYFGDPYYFANAFLPWDAGMAREANILMEKGSKRRSWDWILPFYIGFNYFYFLQDDDKASQYLMESSRRPGAISGAASLAVKLAQKGKRNTNAISFLEEMIRITEDETLKGFYEKRLLLFRALASMDDAVAAYRIKYHKLPRDPQDLITRGIIREFPPEPYGGAYYLDNRGAVKTTSEQAIAVP
jgi:hypothetical protein